MPTRAQGPVGLAQQHMSFAPFQPLEATTASVETSQNPVLAGFAQQRTGFAPFQQSPISRHHNAAAFGTVPRTGSHSPRRQLEALAPPKASCGSSPARIPAACFRAAQNPCGGSSSAFPPRSAALESGQGTPMGSSFETKQNVGGGILTGPLGMPLPVGIGSSRLSFTGAPQPGAPYCIPALLQSARSSAAEMFRFPRSPSTDSDDLYPGVTTTGGNATVASVSANPGGLASDNRGSGRLCRSVQDDDVAEGAAPCQRGKPSAEGTERERAASSRSGRKDRTSGRANGKNDSRDREENSTGLGGVGRSVAGSGRRSGRLSRNLGDDEDEDQRSGKSGSGRLRMSLENDDVATGDVMLPRQRGSAGLSSARRNPPTRHAKGGSEGDGKQPDRTTHEGTKTQLVSRRTHPISQGQAKPKSHVQRSLEEEDCEHRSRSPRVSLTGSDCPPSASEPRERSSLRSVGVVPAGSASRSGGSLPRGDGGASGGGDGASIRQGSRLSRSMERDGAVGRAGDDAAGSRQSSRLGRSVEKEGVACQPGSVVGKKSSTQGVRFGDVHGTGVACEHGVVGRRGVRGGERGGEHRRGGGGQERRQPVKLCRSLDEDEDKEVDVDSDNGKVSRENGVSSGRRLERNLEEDEDGECTRGGSGEGRNPRKSLERHLSDDDDEDDEKKRAVGGKSRGGSRRHKVASKEVEGQASVGAEKNMHKSKGLLHKIFQRD
ncbi:unnamed protein product [Closterium sp. Naga37s-1]|nr:unnamed protein product [Closterium sp. Naga37s-1]